MITAVEPLNKKQYQVLGPKKENRTFHSMQDECSKFSLIKLYWLQFVYNTGEDYSRNANFVSFLARNICLTSVSFLICLIIMSQIHIICFREWRTVKTTSTTYMPHMRWDCKIISPVASTSPQVAQSFHKTNLMSPVVV